MKKFFCLFLSLMLLVAMPALANESPLVSMVNPWVTCTLEEAFAIIGTPFEIAVPDGYGNISCAYLMEKFATTGDVIRLAYQEGDDLFRVHISVPKEGEDAFTFTGEDAILVENNELQGYFTPDTHTLVYYIDQYEISVDSALITEETAAIFLLSVYPEHVDSDEAYPV